MLGLLESLICFMYRVAKIVQKLRTTPMKVYFPKSPPISVQRRMLFVTIRSSHGRIRRRIIMALGSGSDSFRVRRMKKTLDDPQARLKMLIGMETFWAVLMRPVENTMTN